MQAIYCVKHTKIGEGKYVALSHVSVACKWKNNNFDDADTNYYNFKKNVNCRILDDQNMHLWFENIMKSCK